MNRNELKHMLSQVDEQYIAELLDAEETTSEAMPITQKSRRFKGWAAAAAIVCVIGVGSGCLALRGSMGVPPASEVSSNVTNHEAYDLIWEELPEEQLCIDYAQPESGTFVSKSFPVLPFETAQFTIADAYFHCNDNGDADYVFIGMDGNHQTVQLWISDTGQLYPSHFEVDLHADVEREKPAIHIYDTTPIYGDVEHSVPMYEVYYLNNGIAVSMELRNVTAAEAEAMAAALLLEETSAKSIYEATCLYDQYFFRDVSEITMHRNEFSLEMGGEHLSASGTVMPYPESLFTDASTTLYYTADGKPAIAQVVLTGEAGRYADIVLSSDGDYLSVFPIPGDSAGLDRNGITFYGFCSAEEEDYRELYFVTEYGVGCSMLCKGVPDAEMIALADSIIENKLDPAALNKKPSMEARDGYVLLWEETALTEEADHSWGAGGKNIDFTHCPMPFEIENYTVHGTISCSTDGDAVNARVIVSQDEKSIQFTLSDKGKFFTECCKADLSRDADYDKPVIHIYDNTGNPNAYDMTCYELYYLHNGTALTMRTYNYTAEEAEALAAALLQNGTAAAYVLENSAEYEEIDRGDYVLIWDRGAISYLDLAEPVFSFDENDKVEYPSYVEMPFDTSELTKFSSNLRFNADGIPYYAFMEYSNDSQDVEVSVCDTGHPFSSISGSLSYSELDEKYDKPIILILEYFSSSYQLRFKKGDIGVMVSTRGFTAEEAEAFAAALLNEGISAAEIAESIE